jgi:succinyl-diaminopimelate desuccinylase
MNNFDSISLTQTLVRCNTVNPPGDEDACIAQLQELLAAAGFECATTEFAPRRTSLLARVRGAGPRAPLCFTGHIDVVPLGAAPWTTDPFGAEIVDGRLYGRGASDMKSGVAAFVCAAMSLAGELRHGAGLTLVITAGEETGCEGAFHLVSQPQARDFLGCAGALVVGEPTGNQPLLGHKGAFWLAAGVTGRTAHGSTPELGDNAIYKIARATLALEHLELDKQRHPLMGSATLNVGTVHGGLNINSVPDAAELGIDIRTLPGQDHAKVLECLCRRLGPEVSFRKLLDVGSVYTPADDPWIQRVFATCERRTGTGPVPATVAYFSDAAALREPLGRPPTVILGPGEAGMAHQTDEYCHVDRIVQAQAIYTDLIRDWCLADAAA